MLEHADHQGLFVVLETIFGPVAVVNIEIDHRDTRQTVCLQRMLSCHDDVVEEAETHRIFAFRMMSRRTHRAKGVLNFAGHDEVNRHDTRAGRTQRRLPGMMIHRCIRIDMRNSGVRRDAFQAFQMRRRMNSEQLRKGRQRCFVVGEVVIQSLRDHVIADRAQARRALRMKRPHVMEMTIAMRNECGTGHFHLPARNQDGI